MITLCDHIGVPVAGGIHQAKIDPKESADDIAIELFYKSRGQPNAGNRLVYPNLGIY